VTEKTPYPGFQKGNSRQKKTGCPGPSKKTGNHRNRGNRGRNVATDQMGWINGCETHEKKIILRDPGQ